jgi:hypothetical protein
MARFRLEEIPEGQRIWKDDLFLLGILSTSHHQGLVRAGAVVYEEMPRSSWQIHWTSATVSLEDITSVLALIQSTLP